MSQIVLGVDPGSRATGYGLVASDGERFWHLASGCISLPAAMVHSRRLTRIYQQLTEIIARYQPAAVAVEEVFAAHNVQSAIKLGQVRGVILLAAGMAQLPVFEYAPVVLKKAIVGYGQATKTQMLLLVEKLLAVPIANHNIADALALSLCHHFHCRWHQHVEAAALI